MLASIQEPLIQELLVTRPDAAWLPWAVLYFFFIGISLAAALLSLPAYLRGRQADEPQARIALLLMLSCAIAALVALLGDLHQPARFWHFYGWVTPWSWMSIGALLLPAFNGTAMLYSWLALRPQLIERGRQPGAVATLARLLAAGQWQLPGLLQFSALLCGLLALLIALYTGAEVAIIKARLLWHNLQLPLLYLSTALTAAAAATIGLSRLINRPEPASLRGLRRVLQWSALISLGLLLSWLLQGWLGQGSTGEVFRQLADETRWRLNLLLLLGGWLLLALLAIRQGNGWSDSLLVILALSQAWWLRWVVFMDGQSIPKYGAGAYPYELPLGQGGLLSIVGIFGLWLFCVLALNQLLPFRAKQNNQGQEAL